MVDTIACTLCQFPFPLIQTQHILFLHKFESKFWMSSRSNIPKVKADDPDVATIQHFWEHLDDLAKSNPDEYKKFIKSQMDELKTEVGFSLSSPVFP